jgi:hypothetical protein
MAERKAIAREMTGRYRRATKAEKGRMLDELCALTGWSRAHARQVLTGAREGARARRVHRPRPRAYGPELLEPLKRIWAVMGGACGKRMAPFMAEIVDALHRHGELELTEEVRTKLLGASAATLDRLLSSERRRLQVRGRSGTKPGTLLRHQIPIRTFADWDETRPGFCEVDLVGHDGGDPSGQFCQTLDLTCVFSGWVELGALPNKAQRWVHEALEEIAGRLPFPLLGLDSDNGAEFINAHLLAFCAERGITFTRARPWRKNDNCFVEQKNWTVVRQAVGYLRFDTPEELGILKELYRPLAEWVNFFQPQMRLVEKVREGARVRRRYDTPRTPCQRLLESPEIPRRTKAALRDRFLELNPAELRREIGRQQDRLVEMARRKRRRKEVSPPRDHPWRTSWVRQRSTGSRTS